MLTTYEGVLPGLRVEVLLTADIDALGRVAARAGRCDSRAARYDLYLQKADQLGI